MLQVLQSKEKPVMFCKKNEWDVTEVECQHCVL